MYQWKQPFGSFTPRSSESSVWESGFVYLAFDGYFKFFSGLQTKMEVLQHLQMTDYNDLE